MLNNMQNFQNYRDQIKAQVAAMLAYLDTYKIYFKQQVHAWLLWLKEWYAPIKANVYAFMTWSLQQIKQGWQTAYNAITYFMRNFPSLLGQGLRWCGNKFIQGMEFGWRMANYLFAQFLIGMRWGWQMLFEFIKFIPTAIKEIGKALWEGGKLLYRLGKFLLIALKDFILELPSLLSELIKNIGQLLKAVYEGILELVTHAWKFLQIVGEQLAYLARNCLTILKNLAAEAMNNLVRAGRWLGESLFMAVGMAYGASYFIFELVGQLLDSVIASTLGIQLAQYAAFEYLKVGLSLGLTAFAVYQGGRLALFGLSSLLSFLKDNWGMNVGLDRAEPAVRPAAEVVVEPVREFMPLREAAQAIARNDAPLPPADVLLRPAAPALR